MASPSGPWPSSAEEVEAGRPGGALAGRRRPDAGDGRCWAWRTGPMHVRVEEAQGRGARPPLAREGSDGGSGGQRRHGMADPLGEAKREVRSAVVELGSGAPGPDLANDDDDAELRRWLNMAAAGLRGRKTEGVRQRDKEGKGDMARQRICLGSGLSWRRCSSAATLRRRAAGRQRRGRMGGRGSPCGNGAARGRSIRATAVERLGPDGLPRARSGSWRAWRWWEVGRDALRARVGGGRGQVAAGLMEARQVVAEDLAGNEAEMAGGGG